MHYSIFPTKTAWISSGSNLVTGVTQKDQNFGQDEILELKKFYYNNSLDHITRVLLQFDISEVSKSMVNGTIPIPNKENITSSSIFLKLYEAQGNEELSTEYSIGAYPISESWDEGIGKFGDVPKVTDGVSWDYRQNKTGANYLTWSNNSGSGNDSASVSYVSGAAVACSQSFSYSSPDIEMNITSMFGQWYSGSGAGKVDNHGILLRFLGSQETDEQTFGQLKFFSRHTNTIYAPKLEVRWDDHSTVGTASLATKGLTELTMSGVADNYLYMKGLRESYKENDRVKFRVGARKRYIQKTFSTSVQTTSGSYMPSDSCSYAIKDVATDEFIVPFSPQTTMSYDSTSNYFIQWLDGFYPDRVYKIIYKLKYDDGQEQIFDDNFEFKIKR